MALVVILITANGDGLEGRVKVRQSDPDEPPVGEPAGTDCSGGDVAAYRSLVNA